MNDGKKSFHLATFRLPSNNPDVDALNDMISTANQFKDASLRCFDVKLSIAEQKSRLVFPHVVCGCFACEMYLKYLVKKKGNIVPKKHSLIELWNIQADEIKSGFKELYPATDIEVLIRSISDNFVKIRYNHEYQNEILHFGEDKLAMLLPYLSSVCNK